MDIVWGLFLLSVTSGIGFDQSHSITDLNQSFYSSKECVANAKKLNGLPFNEKQIGLERGTLLRYICLVKPSTGTSI